MIQITFSKRDPCTQLLHDITQVDHLWTSMQQGSTHSYTGPLNRLLCAKPKSYDQGRGTKLRVAPTLTLLVVAPGWRLCASWLVSGRSDSDFDSDSDSDSDFDICRITLEPPLGFKSFQCCSILGRWRCITVCFISHNPDYQNTV